MGAYSVNSAEDTVDNALYIFMYVKRAGFYQVYGKYFLIWEELRSVVYTIQRRRGWASIPH